MSEAIHAPARGWGTSELAPVQGGASRDPLPLALALALVALWVIVPALTNTGQWGDHFEQFVWAHSFEWGYYKHPPLPTWLLAAAIRAFGPSPYWTYALAALCTAGTATFTYLLARELLPRRLLGLAMLFWGLQQAFSSRAQLFNHNTVMMVAVSAAAWCVLKAVKTRAGVWWWAAGLAGGAAMLSKYQAIVPLGGLIMGLVLTGELARADTRRGLAIAVLLVLALFAPHFAWMVQHDFTTLHYAAQEGRPLGWGDRGLSVASFLAQQVRLLFPALALAIVLRLVPGLRSKSSLDEGEATAWHRAWFIALILFPLGITVLTCPAFGLRLENQWGYQCLQFVSIWLAWRMRGLAGRRAAAVAVVLQLVFLALQTAAALDGKESGRRDDTQYPARELAARVSRDWFAYTSCPMRLVVGPSFEAGMVSVYTPGTPRVLEGGDFLKSPWVRQEDLDRDGGVYVDNDPSRLPRTAVLVDSMAIHARAGDTGGRIYWAIDPPDYCVAGD